MKAGVPKARTLSVPSREFWQGTRVLSTEEAHFSFFNCFPWLLLENAGCSHLDEESGKKSSFEIFIMVAVLGKIVPN